jgi:hypothetical protein
VTSGFGFVPVGSDSTTNEYGPTVDAALARPFELIESSPYLSVTVLPTLSVSTSMVTTWPPTDRSGVADG